jgi:hypothetical protein
MSQLERGGPGGASVIRQQNQTPGLIPDRVGLTSPGLAVTPIVTKQDVGEQLLIALGLASQVANAAGSLAENRRIRADRSAARQDQIAEKLRNADRGVGVKLAQSAAPSLLNQIRSGELAPPPGVDDQTFFNDVVASVAPETSGDTVEGASDALRSEFFRAIEDGRASRRELARKDAVSAFLDSAYTATDIQSVDSIVSSITSTDPQITERAARQGVLLNSLKGLASRDDGTDKYLSTFDASASEAAKSGIDPTQIMLVRSRLIESRQERDRQAQSDAMEQAAKLVNIGLPPEAVVETVAADQRLTEVQRKNLTEQLSAKIDQEKRDREQQSVDAFYGMVRSGADPAKLLEYVRKSDIPNAEAARIEQAINSGSVARAAAVRDQNINNLRRDIRIGRVPSSDAIDKIVAGMDADPNSPDFIPSDTGGELLNLTQKRATEDAREVLQQRNFENIRKGNAAEVVPATAQDDKAILKELSRSGLILGEAGAPEGLSRPVAAADVLARLGRVPNEISGVIASGAESSDPAVVAKSLTDFAAISSQSKSLAGGMDMPVLARARASYVMSRIDAAQASGAIQSEADLAAFVKQITPDAMRINPQLAKINPSEVMGLLYFKDSTRSSNPEFSKGFGEDVRQKVQDDLVGFLRSPEIQDAFGIRNSWIPFVRNTRGVENPPSYVLDTYRTALEEEYRIQKSFIRDDQKAVEAAKQQAMIRTFETHKPMAWGRNITFGNPGEPGINARVLLQDVKESAGGDIADTLWSRFTPVYRNDIGVRPGWVFYETSDPTSIYRLPDGNPLIVDGVQGRFDVAAEVNKARERRKMDAAMQVVTPFRPLGF